VKRLPDTWGVARWLLDLIEMSFIYLLQMVCIYVNCSARDVEETATVGPHLYVSEGVRQARIL